jgi:GNAT superfamily N-acetyltransferase
MIIKQASIFELEELVVLFNGYRKFYGQKSDLVAAKEFLHKRLANLDSVIFIAREYAQEHEGNILGFAQLYPSYSSIFMQRIWILNDLFVADDYRNKGIGEKLISYSIKFGKSTGASSMVLETGIDNQVGQHLYTRMGWIRKQGYLTYIFKFAK